MLEIGVNGGHSAYVALTANPALEFHGVDIADHAYVRPAVKWLQAEFPGRVFFHEGSCLEVLPGLARRGERFDLFHIDGAKHTYYYDLLNCRPLLASDRQALVVLDDANMGPVQQIWQRAIAQGLVEPDPDFPAMAADQPRRNQIGLLQPLPMYRWWVYRVLAAGRASRRRLGREVKLRLRAA